jgi:hypothetical protein
VLGPLGLTETTTNGVSDQSDDQSDDQDDEGTDDDQAGFDASLGLINTAPVNLDQTIDEPVTSGRDVGIGDGPNGDF